MLGALAIIALVSCTVLCIPALMSDETQAKVFYVMTAVQFSIVALLLIYSLINLLITLRKDHPGELSSELHKIMIFLIYYSVAFATRSIAIILVYFEYWPQFNNYW